MSKAELSQIRMGANRVLIRLTRLGDKITVSGHDLFIGDGELKTTAQCVGEVINFNPNLYYEESDRKNSVHDLVPCEIQKGDTVYFHWACVKEAKDNGAYWEDDHLMILNYQDLYVRKRGDEVYPLNGFILAKEVEKELPKTTLIIPDSMRGVATNMCEITHLGCLVQEYKFGMDDYKRPDNNELKVGDKVILFNHGCIPLEDEFWGSIMGKVRLFRFKRADVHGIKICDSVKPVSTRYLIKPDPQDMVERTALGIYTVDKRRSQTKSQFGTVINKGYDTRGTKIGSRVVIDLNSGVVVNHEGEEMLLVREPNILGEIIDGKIYAK